MTKYMCMCFCFYIVFPAVIVALSVGFSHTYSNNDALWVIKVRHLHTLMYFISTQLQASGGVISLRAGSTMGLGPSSRLPGPVLPSLPVLLKHPQRTRETIMAQGVHWHLSNTRAVWHRLGSRTSRYAPSTCWQPSVLRTDRVFGHKRMRWSGALCIFLHHERDS